MRVPASLLVRLAGALGIGVTLLWLAAAAITGTLLNKEIDEVFDSSLQETAQRILPLAVVDILNREDSGTSQRTAKLRPHAEYLTYIVRDAEGRVLLRSHSAEDADFPPFTAPGFAQTATHRLYFDSALNNTITIAVAETLSHRQHAARSALMTLALPLLVLVPLSLLGVWGVVRHSLWPVQRLSAQIARRGGGDLAPVSDGNLPQELSPIADAVNELLARLRRTLEAERSFAANAAHELRTPIAAALAQTQRLIAETSGQPTQARAAQIEQSLQRLARLSEKMLQLARAEGNAAYADVPQDLKPVALLVIEELKRGEAQPARLGLRLPAGPAMAKISQDAFAILARNLIENALKHAPAGSPVTVELQGDGTLGVINGGPVIAAAELERLMQPLTRGATDAEGTGLGLTIARTIAAAAGGTLTLHSPARGRTDGFEAVFAVAAPTGSDRA